MIAELVYTSVPKGLAVGSSGFCTVAYTEGFPQPLIPACESLSAYRHLYPPGDPREALNPLQYSHTLVTRMDKPFSVLSRVAAYGADYSGRTNKLAHHIVLSPEHRVAQGPSALLQTANLMRAEWRQEPVLLPFSPWLRPEEEPVSYRAAAWEKLTGWAGWAGRLAGAFMEQPRRPAYILFQPGQDLLPLMAEAIALLPPSRRWQVTFSTYCTVLPQSAECLWRCCLPTADFLPRVRSQGESLILDLTAPLTPPASEEEDLWVHGALTGDRPDWEAPRKTSSHPAAALEDAPAEIPHSAGLRAAPGEPHTATAAARKPAWGTWLLVGALAAVAGYAWWKAEYPSARSPVPAPPPVEPVMSNQTVETRPIETSAPVEPEAVAPTPVATNPEPPATAPVPEPTPTPKFEMVLPGLHRENANTMVLTGLPVDLPEADRISFLLAPGFRVVRTNGTLLAAGVSGALAGRGSGEANLMVSHPSRGLDEISLRLKISELRCSARAEWLSSLLALQVERAGRATEVILCSAPWRLPVSRLRYVRPDLPMEYPLDGPQAPVASLLPLIGSASDWTAQLEFTEGPALAIHAIPGSNVFTLVWPETDRPWLESMEQLLVRKPLREWPAQPPDAEPLVAWDVLREVLTDWRASRRDTASLLAPLAARIPPEMLQEPGGALPDASTAGAEEWVEFYRNTLAAAPASDISEVMQEICRHANQELDGVAAPLARLKAGKGIRLSIRYRGVLFIVTEER